MNKTYGAGNAGLTAAPLTNKPVVDDVSDGLRLGNERLSNVLMRIGNLRSHIYGPTPPTELEKEQEKPYGAAAILRHEIDTLHRMLDRTEEALSTLEAFV